MYLGDFRAFLRRNQAPHSLLAVMTMGQEPHDVVTLIDENKVYRHKRNHDALWGMSKLSDWIQTGNSWNDMMRYNYLCNVGLWGGNWVPALGGEGVYNDDTDDWTVRPCRGYRQATEILVIEGCLCPNAEVLAMMDGLEHEKRSKVPQMTRLYAKLPRD